MQIAQHRKFVVALAGAGVVIAGSLGLSVAEGVDESVVGVFDSVVVLLTALGVERVPNAE